MISLHEYIQSQVQIDDEALEIILRQFKVRKVARRKMVLQKNQICMDYYFVSEGALRIHYLHRGKEVTGWIAFEGEFFTEPGSLKSAKPSAFNIEAIDDTTLYTISHDRMKKLYDDFPAWQKFGRIQWENAFLKVIEAIISFQTDSAKSRYLKAMKHAQLLQKVSLKDLSSYLGITPTSLSRLRKEIK